MIEELLSKRKQIRFFRNDVIPERELIDSLLEKTFNLVPSKQSLMPYHVHIFGPDKIDEKEKLYYLSGSIHIEDSFKDTHYNTQLKAPYVLVFTQRLAWPNPFVARKILEGLKYSVCDPATYKKHKTGPALEVGMFMMILTTLCMANNIDVSYTLCLPQDNIKYKEQGLNFTDENIIIGMSLGYEKDSPYIKAIDNTKPNIEEVLSWS